MASYNEIDGVPSHANKWLLEKVLRQEWGFKVMSSRLLWHSAMQDLHHVAGEKADAARMAIEAGVDLELPDPDAIPAAGPARSGKKGCRSHDRQSVGRKLKAQILLGLFEESLRRSRARRPVRISRSIENWRQKQAAAR